MNRVRVSLHRLTENAGPIAVLGVFLLLGAVMFLLVRGYEQQKTIVALQRAQTESSKTEKGILTQVQHLVEQGNSFTDPNSPISKEQQKKTAGYLAQLDEAQRQGRADQLAKIAQMFEECRSLPCAMSTITRILAQPVPVPTFAGMAAVTPTPPAPVPTPLLLPTAKATSAPSTGPTPTLTPAVVIQCLPICPPTK